jgi:hypothetical protein
MMTGPFWHGGVTGLNVGDMLEPGHSRDSRHPGCEICEARARGASAIDMASARPDRVYVTSDRDYARFHASMYGHGDLYIVEPVGELEPSAEDKFPSWTCPAARVVAVVGRGIQLTHKQRRNVYLRWAKLDGIPKRQALEEFERMPRVG